MTPTTYYVSPIGSDSNLGTEAQPWRTIQHAAETLQAGETVLIRAGEYQEWVRPQHSGAEGNPITYAAYPGEIVTLNGAGIQLPANTPRMPRKPHPTHDWPGMRIGHPVQMGGLLQIEKRSHIIVKGLRVINAGPNRDNAGILVKDADNIRIEGNYTCNTVSSGIGVWRCYKVIVTDNEVELACNDGGQECITVAGTDEFEVSYNHVHHGGPGTNGGEGIDIKHGSSNGKVHHNHVHHTSLLGIYADAWNTLTRNIDYYDNLVHDNGWDGITVASEAGGLLENINIYNNVIFRNGRTGFVVGWYGEEDIEHQPIRNIKFINNTLHDNGTRDEGGGIWIENCEAEDILIQNNIVSENRLFQIAFREDTLASGTVFKNNLTFGYKDHPGEIDNPLHADPKLFDPKNGDLRLLSDSPARSAGVAFDGITTDYDGFPRPTGNPDIGAHQFQAEPTS
jgi:hypothetical protein